LRPEAVNFLRLLAGRLRLDPARRKNFFAVGFSIRKNFFAVGFSTRKNFFALTLLARENPYQDSTVLATGSKKHN